MATQTIPKIYLNFETSLAAKMALGASSFTLTSSTDPDGTTLSGTYWLTIDEGATAEEHFIVTLSGAAGTVVTGGLSRVDGSTSVAANKFAHDLGASVKITNAPLLLFARLLNGDDTFNSVNWLGVNSISGLATPTSGETTKAANVAFVNAVSIAGAADAATNVKGIVEIATVAEGAAGTATGSTGATLVIPASSCSNVSSASQLIPVTDADGDIPVEFMELDATWTFTGIVNIQTASNWQLAGTAFTGSMANLNEASTFFGATDITGAEAETLSLGTSSNADSVHTHNKFGLFSGVGHATLHKTYYHWHLPHILGLTDEIWTYTGHTSSDGAYSYLGAWTPSGDVANSAITSFVVYPGIGSINNKILICEFYASFVSVGTDQMAIGLMNDVTPTGDYDDASVVAACFSFDAAGAIYAHTSGGGGTTDHTETALAGVTATSINLYRIEVDLGNATPAVRFYVNGTLKATITTTLPANNPTKFAVGSEGNTNTISYLSMVNFALEI